MKVVRKSFKTAPALFRVLVKHQKLPERFFKKVDSSVTIFEIRLLIEQRQQLKLEPQKRNFIRTIDSNQGIIKSLCKAYYSGPEDQKDAFQDIVLQLWKSFETFRGESEISTWIYRVSLNTLLTKVKKEKMKITTESIGASELFVPVAMADGDIELLNIVIQSLKDLDKAIVILYLEGYKNKEISEILNLTPTNVSTRLNRVRAELKVKFKNQPYEFRQP
jgi:RNA polymerase sigma-70 factor, ECF subfamily